MTACFVTVHLSTQAFANMTISELGCTARVKGQLQNVAAGHNRLLLRSLRHVVVLESLRSTTRLTQRRAFETKKFAKQDKNYE